MRRQTLYEISDDLMRLLEMAKDPDVDPEVLQDTIEAVEGSFEQKAEGCAIVVAHITAHRDMLKKERDRIEKWIRSDEASIDRILGTIKASMQLTGKIKFKTERFAFGLQKNPPSVVIDEPDVYKIPDEYLKYREPEPDKEAIKAAIKEGKDIEFAHLVQTTRLAIR